MSILLFLFHERGVCSLARAVVDYCRTICPTSAHDRQYFRHSFPCRLLAYLTRQAQPALAACCLPRVYQAKASAFRPAGSLPFPDMQMRSPHGRNLQIHDGPCALWCRLPLCGVTNMKDDTRQFSAWKCAHTTLTLLRYSPCISCPRCIA